MIDKQAAVKSGVLILILIEASLAFMLLSMESHAESAVISFENKSRLIINTDKHIYLVQETVSISFDNSNFQDTGLSIQIISPEETYVLLGESADNLKFVPKKSGLYQVQVLDAQKNIIASSNFTVYDGVIGNFTEELAKEQEQTIENAIEGRIMPNSTELGQKTNEIFWSNNNLSAESHSTRLLNIRDSKNKELSALVNEQQLTDAGDLTVSFNDKHFKQMKVKKFNASAQQDNASLGIDVLSTETLGKIKNEYVKKNAAYSYAINPESMNAENITITMLSTGRELWKCALWNFTNQECMGSWVKLMDLEPNTEYNITIGRNDPAFVETGLSTINTNKSLYHPGEQAEIYIVVLNEQGALVSRAHVNLTVSTPSGRNSSFSTADATITEVTRGIYRALYADTGEEGTYNMYAESSGYNTNSVFSSNFSVLSYFSYDIIRKTNFTLDPRTDTLETTLKIQSFAEERFSVVEEIPEEFTIVESSADRIILDANKGVIQQIWDNVTSNAVLSYRTDVPMLWPKLYELRAKVIAGGSEFQEARPWYLAVDPATGNALFGYGINSNVVRYRIWDGTSLSSESSANNVGGNPVWVEMASNPKSDEIVMAQIDDTPSLDVQVWNGSTWKNNQSVSTGVLAAYKGVDVAYETLSGRAIVVYRNGSNAPAYTIWNGTAWSTSASARDSGSAVRWVELASDPNSNYIALVTMDGATTPDINVQIWNGSAWLTSVKELTTDAGDRTVRCFDVEWSNDNYFVVAYADANNLESVRYALYNKTSSTWIVNNSNAIAVNPGNNDLPLWIELAASRSNNYMIVVANDDGTDLHVGYFNGSSLTWVDHGRIVGTVQDNTRRGFDVEFESVSGDALIAFSVNNQHVIRYRTWSNGTLSASDDEVETPGIEQTWFEMAANPDSDEILLAVADDNNNLNGDVWSGSSWTNFSDLASGTISLTGLSFDIEYEKNITRAPSFTTWNLSNSSGIIADFSNQTRGTLITAYAQWNMRINQSYAEHNGLNVMLNFTVNPPFTSRWTNYSFNTSDTDIINRLGLVNISIYAKNFANMWGSKTTPQLHFYLWAYVNLTRINLSEDTVSPGQNTTAFCEVRDANINISIPSYNITYYANSTYLGSNITNSEGSSSLTFSRPAVGTYNITCNITNSTANYYIVTSQKSASAILTVSAAADLTDPVINSVSKSPNPVPYLGNITFTANVTDNVNVSTVRILLNGTNRSMTLNGTNLYVYVFNTSNLSAGTYNFTVYANDTSGNNATPFTGNYTISTTLSVNVTTNSATYSGSENVTINTTVTISVPVNASVYSDVIMGNATTPWWNYSFALRKPIYLNNSNTALTNVSIRVNATNLTNITSCINQIRVASRYKEVMNVNVLGGDNSTWCDIVFLGNVSAYAVNEHNYDVYYNNSAATNPGYPSIPQITSVLINDTYSSDLSNYSNPTGDWGIVSGDLRGDHCNPSQIETIAGLFDFAGWTAGNITFNYYQGGNIEAADCLYYNLYANGAWYSLQNVFCNDLGSTSNTQTIILDSQASYSDFKFGYNCSSFQESGEYVYVDNLTITASRYGSQYVSSAIGNTEKIIANASNASIGDAGNWIWNWNVTGQAAGNYSAVSFANRTTYAPGVGYASFRIGSEAPVINSVSDAPDPVPFTAQILLSANVSAVTYNVSSVWVSVNNTNYSMAPNGTNMYTYSYNTSSLTTGTFTYTVYANNTVGLTATPASSNFTVIKQLNIRVSTDDTVYNLAEQVNVSNNVTIYGASQNASVYSDIILGNATTPWWNNSWKLRKPIYLNNSGGAKTNVSVRVNVTGLTNITNCINEIRVASGYKETTTVNVLGGDNSTWCEILFIANISAGAVNEHNYDVYYNNSAATNPGYSVFYVGTPFIDAYSGTLGNYSNPSGLWSIVSGEATARNCNPPAELETIASLFDFSTWQNGTITFTYYEAGGLEANDCLGYGLYTGSWQSPQTVFCDDLGSSSNTMTIQLDSSYMVSDFRFRYNCSSFTNNGENVYVDNLNITLYRLGDLQVSSAVGAFERIIYSTNNFSIGSSGFWRYNWSTSGQAYGSYTAASLANSSLFNSAYNYSRFSITGNSAPTVFLNNPLNENITRNATIIFNCSITDDINNKNITLYGNWSAGWHANETKNLSGMQNSTTFTKTIADGTYRWNCLAYDNGSLSSFASSNYTFTIDTAAPVVTLISPPNGNSTADAVTVFTYNVTDMNNITSCIFKLDGTVYDTRTSIAKNINQTFEESISNGQHNWTINCTDIAGNSHEPANRTINVSSSPTIWDRRWYETSTFNCTDAPCNISLANTRDTVKNQVYISSISNGTVNTSANALSPFFGSNGVYIPANTIINLSGEFLTNPASKGQVDWYIYYVSAGIDYAICNSTSNAMSMLVTSACTSPSTNLRLQSNDRFRFVVKINNTYDSAIQAYHYWDNLTLSYFEFANLTTLGTIGVDMTQPNTSRVISQNEVFNMSCVYNCTGGTCINLKIVAQYNTSTLNWTNISSSGNLALNAETNPHTIGNVNGSGSTNFSIKGSVSSTNNIRCTAISDYSSANGTTTQQVTVGDTTAPTVSLGNPGNYSWNKNYTIILLYTPGDDTGLANCSLYINGAFNQTNATPLANGTTNNFTISNLSNALYNWTVNCSDTSGNSYKPSPKFFYVDRTLPNISILYPGDGAQLNQSLVYFSFNATDNMAQNLSCNLTIDNDSKVTNMTAQNSSNTTTNYTLNIGVHYWNITCVDYAINNFTSATQWLNITDQPPNITLISPLTNHWNKTGNLTFIYNISENNAVQNCSLILNNAVNQTNSSPITNPGQNNFTLNGVADGTYNWTVNCTDNAALTGAANETRTFYVDTHAPNITLISPAPGANLTNGTTNLQFNATDNMAANMTCNISVDGFVVDPNIAAQNSSLVSRPYTFEDGIHNWSVTCNDTALNINSSQNQTVNVSQFPSVALNSPPPNTWTNGNVTFIFTASDNDNLKNCSLIINSAANATKNDSQLINGQNNFSVVNYPDSVNNAWTVLCYDDGIYSNYYQPATRMFHSDRYPPSISLSAPANGTPFNSSDIMFNWTATDNHFSNLVCNVTIDGENLSNNTAVQSSVPKNITLSNFTDGIYYWNVTCWDGVNNTNISETRWFNVTVPPQVTLSSPGNNNWTNASAIIFIYYVTDDTAIQNCSLYLDGAFNQSNETEVQNNAYNNFTSANVSEGNHNWSVRCADPIGNYGTSAIWNISIDTHIPLIQLHTPAENANLTSNYVNFNWTATDNLAGYLNCSLYVNSSLIESNINATNGTPINRTYIYDDGYYLWNVSCTDLAHNTNFSLTWNFTVEAPPNISLNFPLNNSWNNSANITYTYTPYDPRAIRTCDFYLDDVWQANDPSPTKNVQNSFTINNSPEGRHNWTVNCTDFDWNTAIASPYIIYIDRTKPNISLTTPTPNQNFSTGNVTFNFTATDNLAPNMTCNITINGQQNQTGITAYNGTPYNVTIGVFGDNVYLWNVSCMDRANNTNTSNTQSFNISVIPSVVLASPGNPSWQTSGSITFYFNITDNDGFTNCSLLINNQVNQTRTTGLFNNAQNNITSTLGEGRYNWSIECYDNGTYKNRNVTGNRDIYVDLNPPSVVLYNPTQGQALPNTSSLFNFTAFDNVSLNMTCNLTLDGIVNLTQLNISNGTPYNVTINDLTAGRHYWNVTCLDYVNRSNTSGTWNFTIPLPDFTLNSSDITFVYNTTNPEEGKNITINATIYNIGGTGASNIKVQFYDGDPDLGGTQINGNKTLNLTANSNGSVAVNWTASIGSHNIFVVIDPPLSTNGSIQEENESNNRANKTILIQSWHYLYGNLTGNLTLQNALLTTLFTWNESDVNNSNIFAADYDSNINWSALIAISRNTSNGYVADDFSDIDTALSMSSYTDSVNATYTENGQPKQNLSLTVYGRNITNIPVANSTNNSNFVTGILWDSSDGNTQYNGSQDLIFVTSANIGKQGKYSICDFEMRIPSNLKSYKGATQSVVLYIEIK